MGPKDFFCWSRSEIQSQVHTWIKQKVCRGPFLTHTFLKTLLFWEMSRTTDMSPLSPAVFSQTTSFLSPSSRSGSQTGKVSCCSTAASENVSVGTYQPFIWQCSASAASGLFVTFVSSIRQHFPYRAWCDAGRMGSVGTHWQCVLIGIPYYLKLLLQEAIIFHFTSCLWW